MPNTETTVVECPQTAQDVFDKKYICSTEICRDLGISRPTVLHARRRGFLPDPIVVNGGQLYLWERSIVDPYLAAWRLTLGCRKGNLK